MKSSELIKLLQNDGWFKVHQVGSHIKFHHATKRGHVTVPHPKKDLPIGTVMNIIKQAGLK